MSGNGTVKEIPTMDVVFREDLYPRISTDAVTVQKYAEDLDVLPPIEVNQHLELIDGWHRWTAHRKNDAGVIRALVVETKSDSELLELAIEANSKHGLQLSQSDKQDMARKIYHVTPVKDRDAKKKHLAEILSVSPRTVSGWLSRIDKDSKVARDKQIFDMWLACHTQQEIADTVGCTKETVSEIVCQKTEKLQKSDKPSATHQTDFTIPLYNVWKYKECAEQSEHSGKTNVKIVDNLLYLYTEPLDVVVDPFGGGGSTIDVCKKRLRRYWVSDRKPIVEREHEIRKADAAGDQLPGPARWKDVRLVYLDPPYWKQAAGEYSDDPEDLANMELVEFTDTLTKLVRDYAKKVGGYIAVIIQPTQWRSPDKVFTDHVGDLLRNVKLPVDMRISCPYESQQCNATQVEWAKENKKLLVISRELIVWRTK